MLERPGVPESMKKFYFNLQGFNQYGLLHDDCLHETEIVQLAISRLSPEMQVMEKISSSHKSIDNIIYRKLLIIRGNKHAAVF